MCVALGPGVQGAGVTRCHQGRSARRPLTAHGAPGRRPDAIAVPRAPLLPAGAPVILTPLPGAPTCFPADDGLRPLSLADGAEGTCVLRRRAEAEGLGLLTAASGRCGAPQGFRMLLQAGRPL